MRGNQITISWLHTDAKSHPSGFSLLEIIGVLAVIAILTALVTPKVLDVIGQSKSVGLTTAIKTYEEAVQQYFKDIGSLRPLTPAGVPMLESTGNSAVVTSLPARLTLDASDPLVLTTGQWPRFRGPYLQKFTTGEPQGIGTSMLMPVRTPVALGTTVTPTNLGWDLDGNDGRSDLPTGGTVVYLQVVGVPQSHFVEIDHMLDQGVAVARLWLQQLGSTRTPGLASLVALGGGPPPAPQSQTRGRVKYNAATQTLLVYLAHN